MSLPTLSIQLPALLILSQLQKHGYEAYLVGGAVRDLLRTELDPASPLSNHYFDYDFTTNARPEQIQALFSESFYENQFGTVSVAFSHLQAQFEISQTPPLPEHPRSEKIIDLAKATNIHESLIYQVDQVDQQTDALAASQSQADFDQLLPVYEITTFRTDGTYQDHRRPETVTWGQTLTEDLARRDFTCNAMAIAIDQSVLEKLLSQGTVSKQPWLVPISEYTLIDPYHGFVDYSQGELKTVGRAQDRFAEDALRMLRAIRFSVQLDLEMSSETFEAIASQAQDLTHVSWERIQIEFLKMLGSRQPAKAIELLDETGLLACIIPELLATKGVEQGGHHTTDVWTHSLDALATCPSTDPIVRLATLLHDIGKPNTFKRQNGTITFYNHEIVGSRIANSISKRLKLSRRDRERIFTLVRFHMFHYQPHDTDAAIRRFMRKVGLENIDDILDLREGDRLGSGARKTSWRLEEMKARMIDQLHQPLSVKDLAIGGHELQSELNLTPGPLFGKILQELFEEVLENPELNNREYLLKKAAEIAEH